MAFKIKNGDTAPAYVVDLQDDVDTTPAAINLTSATSVTLKMREHGTTGAPVLDEPMTITTAASGRCTYEWQTGDTDNTGTYDVEFEILWNDGTIETVPNDGYLTVEITDDLDD
jgi:hypothetical protein